MRPTMIAITILLALSFLSGCATVISPVNGMLVTAVSAPVTATSSDTYSKIGVTSCYSILGLVAFGDASINAAMKNGKITKIHHVDYDATSVLGVFSKFTIVVYGE